MGKNKGQMFLVTAIFLVGLVFFVQQILLGYAFLDHAKPIRTNDFYITKNTRDNIFTILLTTDTCEEAEANLLEFAEFISRHTLERGYTLEVRYDLNCTAEWRPV